MVLVVISHQGANTKLSRFDNAGRLVKTHETAQPKASPEDIEHFRRSPSTHLRFGFQSPGDAIARGFQIKIT